ncbi:hypothetical protein LCGC14_2915810 [marine sediment metagenome]|uniref:Uncharacterized protein n=1 Tax=marine sediment metagenome TaxID=412755 RepID=A0A0F8YC38_9ZZZZ
MHDALWQLDHQKPPVLEDYRLGTELNKLVTDMTGILADQVLNRTDVAAIIAASNNRNRVLDTAAGLAVGTADDKLKITNAFHYTIAGGIYLKAATDDIAMAGGALLKCVASQYAAYVVTINATGAIALVKAADAASQALALAAVEDVAIGDDLAVVGVIHIQNNGTDFYPGSAGAGLGSWDDDTTADTYVDFVGVAAESIGAIPVTLTDIVAYTQTFTTIS